MSRPYLGCSKRLTARIATNTQRCIRMVRPSLNLAVWSQTPFVLETAILFSTTRGLYMDSSWRNKNALRCPVTIISTLDDYHHMVPGGFAAGAAFEQPLTFTVAVMVHRSKETEAYQHMLEVLKERIEEHAKRLLSKGSEPRYHGQRSRDTLEKYCTEVSEDDYAPRFVMIDGDDAERGAIETVFSGTPVRLCQFHFMQACISKITSQFGRSKEGGRKTDRVLQCLRKLQRCPNESDCPSAYQSFQDKIDSIANDRGEASEALGTLLQPVLVQRTLAAILY